MSTVLLLIHIMVAVALVGVVLLQRSEGGALGIGGGGGGGGGGGFMTGRGVGNALTKATAILAACFFATSMSLSILATHTRTTPSILPAGSSDGLAPLQIPATPAPATAPATPAAPQAPQSE